MLVPVLRLVPVVVLAGNSTMTSTRTCTSTRTSTRTCTRTRTRTGTGTRTRTSACIGARTSFRTSTMHIRAYTHTPIYIRQHTCI